MTDWLVLLVGGLIFGAGLVGAIVLPRRWSLLSFIASLAGLLGGLVAQGAVVAGYGTLPATLTGAAFLLSGIAFGYVIAAALLPQAVPRVKLSRVDLPDAPQGDAVVLFSYTDPERYSVGYVAAFHELLTETSAVKVELPATPFIYLSTKARYRAMRGIAPGPATGHALAVRVRAHLGEDVPVSLAWWFPRGSLAEAVGAALEAGAARITVVVLGNPDDEHVDHAKELLSRSEMLDACTRVTFAPPIWEDPDLPAALARRILDAAAGADPSTIGVALVCSGVPEQWAQRHLEASASENYLNQRARMILTPAGINERHVRVAWLGWQVPDVTEVVRHLAALGCTTIIVVPSASVLPDIETEIDLPHAVHLAQMPAGVSAVVLPPWGDDEAVARAIARSARECLESEQAG